MKKYILFICFSAVFFSEGAMLNQSRLTLDEIGNRTGTDKGSAHDYNRIYNFYFEPIRNEPIKFLEIGFLVGNSARMWDKYFQNAELYFIDINADFFKYTHDLSSRCSLHIVDQSNKQELLNFISKVGGNFDIILDDGGHTMEQQQTSFNTLFPYVRQGGVYIIEDLHTSYWGCFGTGSDGEARKPKLGPHSTILFLENLVNDLNFVSSYTGYGSIEAARKHSPSGFFDSLTIYQRDIKSIHFYKSLCFVFKW